MRSIYISGGKANNTAVNIIKGHLEGIGHRVTRDAKDPFGWDVTLRWGVSYHGDKPALNAGVNRFDKYDCFEEFEKCGVPCPKTRTLVEAQNLFRIGWPFPTPWLARKRHHVKGKDIIVCKTKEDVLQVLHKGEHHFFSVFIPTQTEYRVWVFQGKVLGIYEKVFKGEGVYEGFMRNRRFGFKFEKKDNLRGMKEIEVPCVKAVKALGMDFGGIDVILGKDGKIYILEVNSMPAIETEKRSSGIRLAHHVSDWAETQ